MTRGQENRIIHLKQKLKDMRREMEGLKRRAEYHEYRYQIRQEAIEELYQYCAHGTANILSHDLPAEHLKTLRSVLGQMRMLATAARNPPDP